MAIRSPPASKATIEDPDLKVALAQAQASHNGTLAKFEQTIAESRPVDIAAARAGRPGQD